MSWFRIDDSFSDHPKVRRIPRTRRLAAIGLWSLAGSWSAKHSTDGVIPGYMIEELAGTKALAGTLVEVGLWHRGDHACPACPSAEASAFVAHAFTERNPSRAQVEAERRAGAERQRQSRERKRSAGGELDAPPPDDLQEHAGVTPMSRRDTTVVTGGQERESRPCDGDPTRPDPSLPLEGLSSPRIAAAIPDEQAASKPKRKPEPDREDVRHLCTLLADLMVQNGCRRPNINEDWKREARLLLDRDGIPLNLAEHVLRWSQADSFWQANVQSMPTFRAKFDQLRLKRKEQADRAKAGLVVVGANGVPIDPARAEDMRRNPHKYR
jgi:hypothetical protein